MSLPASDTGDAPRVHLGRQPILDRQQRLCAYELLFRSGAANHAQVYNQAQATATVIARAFGDVAMADVLGSCRGFINVDEDMLFSDALELLPAPLVVLEVLETVPPTPAVVERCKVLRSRGFTLALDDVIQVEAQFAPLFELAEIIKVDIQPLDDAALTAIAATLRPMGKVLLAEKVDTRERMELCLELGFDLFQGYFFARPTVISGRRVDHSQMTLMRIMSLILNDADTVELEAALKLDPGLSVNLLRLTNSVSCGVPARIESLRHAITLLGRRQLQRWVQLLVYAHGGGPPLSTNPLLMMASTRGRLLELLANSITGRNPELPERAFMTGIMSLMPALLGQPIEKLIEQLPLVDEVVAALTLGEGQLGALLEISTESESGDYSGLGECLARCPGLDGDTINEKLAEAMVWAANLAQERA